MKQRKKEEKLARRRAAWERMIEQARNSSIVNPSSFKKPGSIRK